MKFKFAVGRETDKQLASLRSALPYAMRRLVVFTVKFTFKDADYEVKVIDSNHSIEKFKIRSKKEYTTEHWKEIMEKGVRSLRRNYNLKPGSYWVTSRPCGISIPVEVEYELDSPELKIITVSADTTWKTEYRLDSYQFNRKNSSDEEIIVENKNYEI